MRAGRWWCAARLATRAGAPADASAARTNDSFRASKWSNQTACASGEFAIGDDPIITGKIALAHMKEFPDYYERLERMESEAERDWAEKS